MKDFNTKHIYIGYCLNFPVQKYVTERKARKIHSSARPDDWIMAQDE